jgi:hypothetical protein
MRYDTYVAAGSSEQMQRCAIQQSVYKLREIQVGNPRRIARANGAMTDFERKRHCMKVISGDVLDLRNRNA